MAEANHWKVGLVTVLFGVGTYVGLMVTAAQMKKADPLLAITYLDESAQGLRVDADVQMRGVRIGRVKSFGLAEDGRHVEVVCELDDRTLRMLGIRDVQARWGEGEFAPANLRAFLASSGLTGVLVIQMDFFSPPSEYPLPKLDFEPPWNYVPAVTSFAGAVQRDLPSILASMPGRLDQVEEVITQVEAILDEQDPLAMANQARADMEAAQRRIDDTDVAAIESRTLTFIADAQAKVDEARATLAELERERHVETRLQKLEELVAALGKTLEDFDAEAVAQLQRDSAELAKTAGLLAEPLRMLREWAIWSRDYWQGWDDTLRPLGEDPSELFFDKPRPEPDADD